MGGFPLGEVAGLGAVVQRDPPPPSPGACLFLHRPCTTALQRHYSEELGGNSWEGAASPTWGETREEPQVWHAQLVEREPTHSSSAVAGRGVADNSLEGRRRECF